MRINRISTAAARWACEQWHYSRKLPASPCCAYGVWETEFIGAVVLTAGNNPNLAKPFGLEQSSVVELARIALRAHATPVSRIIAVTLRLFARTHPHVRLVISYADEAQGHLGRIYQAGGWTYLGVSVSTLMVIDGRARHTRSVVGSQYGKYGHRSASLVARGSHRIRAMPKHRYAIALDGNLRVVLTAMAKPYPRILASAGVAGPPHPAAADVRSDPLAPA